MCGGSVTFTSDLQYQGERGLSPKTEEGTEGWASQAETTEYQACKMVSTE